MVHLVVVANDDTDDPSMENIKCAPVFSWNKCENQSVLAIPFGSNGFSDLLSSDMANELPMNKKYKFEFKLPKAVWRGGNQGRDRSEVYKWTVNHTDLIDYKFASSSTYMAMWKQERLYKYIIDVDGVAWSSRFIYLLNLDMVIIKHVPSSRGTCRDRVYTDFCNEMLIPGKHYLTFSNEVELVKVIKLLIKKGDQYAITMIKERKQVAERYCSKDAQLVYFYAIFNAYARLQRFKVALDKNAVLIPPDVEPLSFLEVILIFFVFISIVLCVHVCITTRKFHSHEYSKDARMTLP